jgi:hypothetical protein
LTPGQAEIWVASQMCDMASCAFNESDAVLIRGRLDVPRFAEAVTQVLGEQEAFRYRFDSEGTSQWVDTEASFELPLIDLSQLDAVRRSARLDALVAEEAVTPFDLENGPIVRVRLVKLDAEQHLFLIYCHCIVFDGYSAEIVMRRIAETYSPKAADAPAPAATLPYSVYIHRTQRPDAVASAASMDYWRSVFADDLPLPLDLPTDRPRDRVRSYRGATLHRELAPTLSHSLRECAKSLNTTVYVLLLASFQALLARLANQEDIVLGVPMAGQVRHRLETVGYCVNALPLRAAADHDKPFADFVHETQRNLFDAFDHQETPLSEILRALHVPRDPSRLPLIEVVFNYSRYFANLELDGCTVATHENPRRAIHFDLFFNIVESGGRLVVDWDYCSDLFDATTIERWVDHYGELLQGVVDDSRRSIGELPLMSMRQRAEVAAMWGHT